MPQPKVQAPAVFNFNLFIHISGIHAATPEILRHSCSTSKWSYNNRFEHELKHRMVTGGHKVLTIKNPDNLFSDDCHFGDELTKQRFKFRFVNEVADGCNVHVACEQKGNYCYSYYLNIFINLLHGRQESICIPNYSQRFYMERHEELVMVLNYPNGYLDETDVFSCKILYHCQNVSFL